MEPIAPTKPTDSTSAIRSLSKTLASLRRSRLGPLEIIILIAVILMLVAGFVSIYFVIDQQLAAADREALAAADRDRMEDILANTASLLAELRAAVDAGPESQRRAIELILAGIQELLDRQTQIIVREQEARTVVIVVSPSPYPSPVYRPCQINPATGRCLAGNRKR